jgi:AcrR family transcriptional regulator
VSLQTSIQDAPDDRARVSGAIGTYLAFIESEPAIIRFLIHRSLETINETGVALSDFVSRVAQIVTTALGEGLRERGLDSGAAEPWSFAIVGAVHMAGDWWQERRTMPRERLVEYLTSLVWDGMQHVQAPAHAGMTIGSEGGLS